MRKIKHKYGVRLTATIIALILAAPIMFEHRSAIAAWLSPPVIAPGKNEVGIDDSDDVSRRIQKANVLFFLDTSHPMMIEPRGRMPYVVLNNNSAAPANNIDSTATQTAFGYNKAGAIDMMKYVTYGVGTVPPVDSYYKAPVVNFSNFGRDTNAANNLSPTNTNLDHPDNYYKYYSPYNTAKDTAKRNLSAMFVNQNDLYSGNASSYTTVSPAGYKGWANGSIPGTAFTHNYNYKTAVSGNPALPYMLVFKNPAHWKTPPASFTVNDLVPNDSRMYQMKLVMWRLLEDKMLFENIRFGMSTVFSTAQTLDDTLTADAPSSTVTRMDNIYHHVYKIAPFSTNYGEYTNGIYYVLNDVTYTSNGIPTITANTGTGSYGYYGIQAGTWGVYANGFVDFQRRAWLRVPIAEYDKAWTTKGGSGVICLISTGSGSG